MHYLLLHLKVVFEYVTFINLCYDSCSVLKTNIVISWSTITEHQIGWSIGNNVDLY
jgi:hypothetical protein